MFDKSAQRKNGSRTLNVMFGDFCYKNRHTLYAQYTPLAIGLIAQYAKQQFGNDIKVSLFKTIDKFFRSSCSANPRCCWFVGLFLEYCLKSICS